jgi:hypothetical protein
MLGVEEVEVVHKKTLIYPNSSLSAISHSPSLRVFQSELAHSRQYKDRKF